MSPPLTVLIDCKFDFEVNVFKIENNDGDLIKRVHKLNQINFPGLLT